MTREVPDDVLDSETDFKQHLDLDLDLLDLVKLKNIQYTGCAKKIIPLKKRYNSAIYCYFELKICTLLPKEICNTTAKFR
jgi:hypothetical protein